MRPSPQVGLLEKLVIVTSCSCEGDPIPRGKGYSPGVCQVLSRSHEVPIVGKQAPTLLS